MLNFNDFLEFLEPIEQHRFHQAFEKDRGITVEEAGFDREVFVSVSVFILCAFPWVNTDQGHDYWYTIYNRIHEATNFELVSNPN